VVVLFEAVAVAIKVVPIITLLIIPINRMAATTHNILKARRRIKVPHSKLATMVLMVSRTLPHT
jgi:hypothetical protein